MIELIQACSPNVYLPVAQAIIKTESNFNPYAIGVNKGGRAVKQPTNYNQAVQVAKRLLSQGFNIDLGLTQINSANLNWLGLSVEQAFNPCSNLKAMQTVYLTCHNKAGTTGLGTRMQRAFSCYNTGNMTRGFKNGYVNKTTKHFNEFVARAGQLGQGYSGQVANIQYQQYPNVQTNPISAQPDDSPNNAHTHAQERLEVSPIGIQPKMPNVAQNASMTQNATPVQMQEQVMQVTPQSQIEVQQLQYHNWDIFSDYGFSK